jgi:hypothetical protein
MQIKYGRIRIDGELCGYAEYEENGHKIQMISKPYGSLIVLDNGKPRKPTYEESLIWAKVAGWLGEDDLWRGLGLKRGGD